MGEDGDGWLELDEDGVPLGRWGWDDDLEEWVFEEFIPLADMPQTGYKDTPLYLLSLMGLSLIGMGVAISSLTKKRAKYDR